MLLVSCGEALRSPGGALRKLFAQEKIHIMPCCYDGITARCVERAGFELSFMTGFGVAASRGYADAGLLSFGEMQDSARIIASSLRSIPFIADGDSQGRRTLGLTLSSLRRSNVRELEQKEQNAFQKTRGKLCKNSRGEMITRPDM